jgi:dihydroorotase
MNDMMIDEDGRFKMNPPIRSEEDRLALIEGIKDGTIDMIATDHAPHSAEEKSKGLAGSLMGVVGLETAFAVLYTELVEKGVITLEKLVELMAINPAKRFGVKGGSLKNGEKGRFSVFNIADEYEIDPEKFETKGRSTPSKGKKVKGSLKMSFFA